MKSIADLEAAFFAAENRANAAFQTRNLYPAKWQQAHAEREAAAAALRAAVEAAYVEPQPAEPVEREYDHQQYLDEREARIADRQMQEEEAEWRSRNSRPCGSV